MKILRSLLVSASLAVVCTTLPTDALAWGAQGHRLVARIAETGLTPQVQAEVDRLLAGEPDPTLHAIAPWADALRANDPDLGKRSAGWHYINMGEDGCHYVPDRHCRNGNCVIEALKAQSAILADRSRPDAERAQALKFVVHLVGDIHQPMHAGYAHDKGGNDFQVQFNGRGSNLHSLWDSGMFYQQGLDDDAYLQRLLALPPQQQTTRLSLSRDITAWAEDSCRVAIAPGTYPKKHTLDAAYSDVYRPIAEARVRLAGEHLAALLNTLLDAPQRP
ncbi:S1/P1 nuclease [Stenotrophomonas sp. YIM B06876]|uniref:S1/P1 nuclease n=1 Tax=Stenotrophomonas sp. YIM B06876 TaxID=3060211 RepID=UPI00273879C0|nr:S1/P1 nuclease [Stenotrophomonas sp. YIM B06876]